MQYTANSLEQYWMPFTPNRQFKANPRLLVKAEGMYYWNHKGDRIIDSVSGLFCTNAGHARPEIREAVSRQLAEMDFAPPFQYGHPGVFELANRVAALMPSGLDHVFFTCDGSEAVETALKVSLAYHRARGQGQRVRFVGRARGYHGVNFGGLSVSGMVRNRDIFASALPGNVCHMRHTALPENKFTAGQAETGAHLADDLQQMVDLYGGDTIAACIVEPIAGSTGCLVPPKGYLQRLREICDKHGILLIFDEVITGFGRTGKSFASHSFGVTPDAVTMAKGITNGNIPMGAVAFRDKIYDAVVGSAQVDAIELFHGYTYSGHPVAAAAGLATLDIYERDRLFERGEAMAPYFMDAIMSLKGIPAVTDLRCYGLFAGIDVAAGAKPGERGLELLQKLFFEGGLLPRVTMDTLIVAPALVAEKTHIDQIVDTLRKYLSAY